MIGADERFTETLRNACIAGSCRQMARIVPSAALGLNQTADYHSRKVGALLDEWMTLGGLNEAARP